MLAYLIQGFVLGLGASATPGPMQAFFLAQTLKNGWLRTLPATLAPLASDVPIISLVLLVLTQTSNRVLDVLQVIGGGFILYLAWGAWSSARQSSADVEPEAAYAGFFKAVTMNLFNPNPYIFWSIIGGPIVIEAWRTSSGLAISFLSGFYVALVGGFALTILIFALARQLGPKVTYVLSIVSAVALLAFGLYQIWAGVIALLSGGT